MPADLLDRESWMRKRGELEEFLLHPKRHATLASSHKQALETNRETNKTG